MPGFFGDIEPIRFEGRDSANPFAFRHYDADETVMGKPLGDHLRFAVAYWHALAWEGGDPFGGPTFERPWHPQDAAGSMEKKAEAAFEMFRILKVPYFCWHDLDVRPEGGTFAESRDRLFAWVDLALAKMEETGVKCLWGTANMFTHRRWMAGAATNPDPEVFAYAAATVKSCIDATLRLGGENYVLWGGREGYETLLNTDMGREREQAGRFLQMVVEYARKTGFKGTVLVEPKPQEPSKHQYDYDVATVYAFLKDFGLEGEVKVNIEQGHAILAGHSFEHELHLARSLGILGSIDMNRNDYQSGWDTDQFPNSVAEVALAYYEILKAGGIAPGGTNFDAKIRRQSIDPEDLILAHIGAMDVCAAGLRAAARMLEDGEVETLLAERYAGWDGKAAKSMLKGGLEDAARPVEEGKIDPQPRSGGQERLEMIVNCYVSWRGMSYLGIDLGTSGLRALLVDGDGRPVGAAERRYGVANPHPGWSEQDPADWLAALDGAVGELRSKHGEFASLRGIGVAGHMHGAVLLDGGDRPLRPCILWNDTRSSGQAARLDAVPAFREISGNIVFPGFTAPKLEWVRENEPEIHASIAKVLLPASYMNLHLTGGHVADMSDSAGTSWLDTGRRDWSGDLLAAGRMRRDQMPALVEGAAPAGELRAELAAAWGTGGRVVVAGGAGDNAAAACGIGALREGQGFVSLGTSGVVLAARDGYRPDPASAVHTFCHAVPDRWYQMGVMLAATDSLDWLARITGESPEALTAGLEGELSPGTVGFLPYLSGERTPHNDAEIRGAFTGLATATSRGDLARAVLEGVAFGLRDGLEALKATGAGLETPFAIGGGTGSDCWLRLVATTLGLPLGIPDKGEFGAALGAARLGMAAATGEAPEAVMAPPAISRTIEPDRDRQAEFDDAYQAFRAAYKAIKPVQRQPRRSGP